MAARGLSISDIVLVEIAYAVLAILLEVPSGAISDRWSRKYVLTLNMVFFMGNTLLWVLAQDIRLFLLGSVAASIHMALRSGTDTSFLYDTLKQLDKDQAFEKTLGNAIFWENTMAIVAGVAGGIVADYFGLEVPFWITLGFSFIALLIALSFTEPRIHRTTGEMTYWKHIAETGKYIINHKSLVHLIAFAVILGATFILMDEYSQLYFVKVGVPILALGYLTAVGSGIQAITGKFAYRLSRYNRNTIFALAIVISITGFVIVGLTGSWYGIPFTFLPWLAYFSVYPLILNDLHKELPSGQRATAESFMNLLRGLVFIPIGLGFSSLADRVSIFTAYTGIGAFLVVYLVVFLIVSYRRIGLS
jgi:predicted MFS family arabinose efflux permease